MENQTKFISSVQWLLIFSLAVLLAIAIPARVFAAQYGNEYPDYIPASGGAYIEVRTNVSNLGTCALFFNDETKNNTFGFTGTGSNLFNITGSTVSGTAYTPQGNSYQVRLQGLNTLEYYYEGTSWQDREWRSVTVQEILNTNVEFTDDTGRERGNTIDIFDQNPFSYVMLFMVGAADLLLLVICFKKVT